MVWTIDGPQGNESAKIKYDLVPYTRGRVLDLGCGPFKAFPHFIGVDNGHHDQNFGWQNKADIIVDSCEKLDLFASQSMDAVFSSHLLEHIEKHEKALKEWYRVLKPGGYMCLYLPHKEFYPNVGQPGANPDHKHDFHPNDIIEVMKGVGGWDLVRNEDRNEDHEYSFFQVYKKMTIKEHRFSCNNPKPEKKAAVIRYGGYGDLIQASSIFPGLKEQGYHVTLFTTPNGYPIVRNDPHIDAVILQDKNQVPNDELLNFWDVVEKRYDKVINLSESVEGHLLTFPGPGRMSNRWPEHIRQKYLNKNYLEWTHELADVPLPPRQKFYMSAEDIDWCKQERAKMGDDAYVIMWSLSGSSVHKTWPHIDEVLAKLMISHPKVKVVLVGDEICQILEQGWENEPRIYCRSGKWNMRQSMSFAYQADMIIGPETGLLNAAGLLDIPKIVFLSHSSKENLTKHWKKTIALEPKTACYPCHRMHYNFDHCLQEQTTGASQCMYDISGDDVYNSIEQAMKKIWPLQAA